MKNYEKLYLAASASIAMILFSILISSVALASNVQNTSSAVSNGYTADKDRNNSSMLGTVIGNVTAMIPVGIWPSGVAVNPAGTKLYVTSYGSEYFIGDHLDVYNNTVFVIDTTTNKITAIVKVGYGPKGVAVTPDGSKVYVTNYINDTVSIINTTTNKVISTVNVGYGPTGVAVSPDGSKAYVTNYNNVSVIDTATNRVTATVPVPVDVGLTGVAVNPDGTKVYVTNGNYYREGNVSVIDTATNRVTATVPLGIGPTGVVVNPAGTKVYVTSYKYYGSGTVYVIDSATNNVTAEVPTILGSRGIAINPEGTKVYVPEYLTNDVSVIDTATNYVIGTVRIGDYYLQWPLGVTINPDGTKIYVTVGNFSSPGSVSVIDTTTDRGPIATTLNATNITSTDATLNVHVQRPSAVYLIWFRCKNYEKDLLK